MPFGIWKSNVHIRDDLLFNPNIYGTCSRPGETVRECNILKGRLRGADGCMAMFQVCAV